MTLNITVLSAEGVYQSADFRLAAFEPGPDGRWITKVDNSPKVVHLSYKTWTGCLTYCGVGMWETRPTYETVADWITEPNRGELTFDQVADLLASNGSKWIDAITTALKRFQPHTFVLAGFVADCPQVALISNTHSIAGRIPRRTGEGLKCSSLASRDTHVFVTGIDNAVSRADRLLLKRLASNGPDHNVVRHHLARVNAKAAATLEANNGISKACLCYSIGKRGGGAGEVHGELKGKFVPVQIQSGMNLTKWLGQVMNLGPNAQLKSVSFATSASSDAVAAEPIDCDLHFVVDDAAEDFDPTSIGEINEFHLEPSAVSNSGAIVGQLRYPIHTSPQAFVWRQGQSIQGLGTFGGPTSHAADVNSLGVVVGNAHRADGLTRAFRWSHDQEGLLDLGTSGGSTAMAHAINDRGEIVGATNLSTGQPIHAAERAFIWTEADGMLPIPGLGDAWSRASDINNSGWVVGWYQPTGQVRGFLWYKDIGLVPIEGPIGRPFYVRAINDAGTVIGEGDDEHGVRRAMLWTVDAGLSFLDVPVAFHPTAIDEDGNIVGFERGAPWIRPWLCRPDGSVVKLSYAENHHTEPRGISSGMVVGTARKEQWKHVHPLIWRRTAISQAPPLGAA